MSNISTRAGRLLGVAYEDKFFVHLVEIRRVWLCLALISQGGRLEGIWRYGLFPVDLWFSPLHKYHAGAWHGAYATNRRGKVSSFYFDR